MTRALIIGSEGQDGRILFDRLAAEGVDVLGLGNGSIRGAASDEIGIIDIGCRTQVANLIDGWKPDEVYYLAAVHQAAQDSLASDDAGLFERSLGTHVTSLVYFLEAMKEQRAGPRLFYAASSLVFGNPDQELQDENTPFRPQCVYGITKVAGVLACRYYRNQHGVRASSGFLYNHESPLRTRNFVSQKIVQAAVAAARGAREQLVLGDLSARVDWGYAPEFVEAMTLIVRGAEVDDYVIATGVTHAVKEFVEIAFGAVGLDWRLYVVEQRDLLTRPSVTRIGDAGRLRARTGWMPKVGFAEMVGILVEAAQREDAA